MLNVCIAISSIQRKRHLLQQSFADNLHLRYWTLGLTRKQCCLEFCYLSLYYLNALFWHNRRNHFTLYCLFNQKWTTLFLLSKQKKKMNCQLRRWAVKENRLPQARALLLPNQVRKRNLAYNILLREIFFITTKIKDPRFKTSLPACTTSTFIYSYQLSLIDAYLK